MAPPNKTFKASERYKEFINARVPSLDNSARVTNDNSHFYSTRVKYAKEMASLHHDFVQIYSADNKNKLKVGDNTPAVDRRIRINRYVVGGVVGSCLSNVKSILFSTCVQIQITINLKKSA